MNRERSIKLLNKAVGDELAASGSVEPIADPAEMLAKACGMEQGGADDYNQAAQECGANADVASKEIFEALVSEEEGHFGKKTEGAAQ